ncbi:hypothetical protein [Dethiosulfovibrio peptidovorans]|nr:hypothetical protein [Dethiosulfovibrio peptidovorans]
MKHVFLATCMALLICVGSALGAPTQKELKDTSLFLSNFTELGFMEIDVEEMSHPDSYPDLVRFGIQHNYINNFKSRVRQNKDNPGDTGELRIKAAYVEESVQKYFGIKIKADRSVDQSDPPYFFKGGYFSFFGADGEAPWYARVEEALSPKKGIWELRGEIYNADDPEDIFGTFNATIKEAMWGKKRTYVMVSMTSEYSPSN